MKPLLKSLKEMSPDLSAPAVGVRREHLDNWVILLLILYAGKLFRLQ
ncbi:hypothetical protein OROGR_004836 [Orobanche gracilis]